MMKQFPIIRFAAIITICTEFVQGLGISCLPSSYQGSCRQSQSLRRRSIPPSIFFGSSKAVSKVLSAETKSDGKMLPITATLFSKANNINEENFKNNEKMKEEVRKSVDILVTALKESLVNSSNDVNEDSQLECFESLTLYGQHCQKIKKLIENEEFRGNIRIVQGRLIQLKQKNKQRKVSKTDTSSIPNNLHLQMTLKYHGATDVAQNWKMTDIPHHLKRVLLFGFGNPIEDDSMKKDVINSISSLLPLSEWNDQIPTPTNGVDEENENMSKSSQTPSSFSPIFKGAKLVTSQGAWELTLPSFPKSMTNNHKSLKKKVSNKAQCVYKAKAKSSSKMTTTKPILSHDVPKNVPLQTTEPFLRSLGVTDIKGRARPSMSSKLRQCQRFVQIVGALSDKHLAKDYRKNAKNTDENNTLSFVDMGCGRGYLTFALHAYLTQNRYRLKSRGIEMRPKLVKECNSIVQDLIDSSSIHEGLKFVQGTIEQALESAHQNKHNVGVNDDLDILIALHACDTATDDALWYGLQRNARLIVVAPCCHREVRSHLDKLSLQNEDGSHVLADILRHGIYRERVGEIATDSLRAILLELANYQVQVFEFIGGEHTSKNVMITAVKKKKTLTKLQKEKIRSRLYAFAQLNGIKTQRLAMWMKESLIPPEIYDGQKMEDCAGSQWFPKSRVRESRGRMPSPPIGLDI